MKTKRTVKKTTEKVVKKSPKKSRRTAKAAGATKTVQYAGVKVGQKVPDFSVESTSGQSLKAKDLKGRLTVLYFYPKDNTPGCTLEGQDFRKLHAKFSKLNAQILGVSRDSLKSHENFKAKCDFPFELLSDPDDQLAKLFDVIQMKSLYGRKFMGIERSTFVIDTEGILRHEWRKVKVNGHADEVLETIAREI